jgi:hypothetical protein
MTSSSYIDPCFTRSDHIVIENLLKDVNPGVTVNGKEKRDRVVLDGKFIPFQGSPTAKHEINNITEPFEESKKSKDDNQETIAALEALNDPEHEDFDPTVFVAWDLHNVKIPPVIDQFLLQPYIKLGRTIVRSDTDVVLLTHLILYFTTSVPSGLYLFYNFTWIHGVLHWLMQSYYVGTYTLMMHQHIHGGGILAKKYAWFDTLFPYVLDPMMGHTWNSYFFHHIKHHHVEGNGPNDLSSTLRYQRDDLLNFAHYVGRFFFLIWFDLPRYFLRKNKPGFALKAAFFELSNYATIYLLASRVSFRATLFTFILPLLMLRVGLMVGNWGQHAFVDEEDPDSDFRSSITLIDVAVSLYSSHLSIPIILTKPRATATASMMVTTRRTT